MAMTMRRTRHKLEPQCVHQESSTDKENSNNLEETLQTNKLSVHMLQVCGHIKHVVVLVVLLCEQFNRHQCLHIHFSLFSESFLIVHNSIPVRCISVSNYGPDDILSFLDFSHICGHEVFPS